MEQCLLLPWVYQTWRDLEYPLRDKLRVRDGRLLAECLRRANLSCSINAALRLKDLEEYCTDLTDKLSNVQKSFEEAQEEINRFSSRVSDNNVSFSKSADKAFRAERATKRLAKTRPTSRNAKKR